MEQSRNETTHHNSVYYKTKNLGLLNAYPLIMSLRLLAFVLIFGVSSAYAKIVNLGRSDLYRTNFIQDRYKAVIETIVPGDVVTFSDGAQFTINKKLGHGSTSVIFSIKERPFQILRLPISISRIHSNIDTITGFIELSDHGLPLVKIDPQSNSQYVLADRIPDDFMTIAEMALGVDFGREKWFYGNSTVQMSSLAQKYRSFRVGLQKPLDEHLRAEMLSAFWIFLRSLAPFDFIQDLHEGNVVYDRSLKSWVIIDWQNGSQLLKSENQILESADSTIDLLFILIRKSLRFGFKMKPEAERFWKMLYEASILELKKAKIDYLNNPELMKYHLGLPTASSTASVEISCQKLLAN